MKKCHRYFDRNYINLQIAFGKYGQFNDINYFNPEYEISSHLFVSSPVSFIKSFRFQSIVYPYPQINLESDFKYDIEKIINNIEVRITEAKEALSVIEETKKLFKNLKNELKRYKTVNENILKNLKRISSQYFYLSSDFTKKSEIFDFITISNRIDLDYEMKMMQDFTYESVLNILDKIQQYFDVAEKRINDIDNYAKRIINENFNSKS